MRKAGNKLRITAQLIKVDDGFHLYSEKFDRELEDIFAIQDEISLAILNGIKLKLFGKEKEAVQKKYTENVEAYQLYLKARYHFNKLTPDDFLKAIEYYQSAIDIDSEYAIAYTEMANCYFDSHFFNWLSKEQRFPQAIASADKAFQLDDKIAESYIAMGRIKLWSEWDFTEALKELEKGILINPNSVEGLRQLGVWNMVMKNYAEAYMYLQKADNLDPFSLLSIFYMGGYHQWDGDFEKMLEYGNRLIVQESKFFGSHLVAELANVQLHQYEEEIIELELAAKLNGDMSTLSYLGMAYGLKDKKMKIRKVLEKMNNLASGQDGGNAYFGHVYAALEEWDRAFEYLDKAVRNHEGVILYIKSIFQDWFPEMMQDPRSKELFKKIGLPD